MYGMSLNSSLSIGLFLIVFLSLKTKLNILWESHEMNMHTNTKNHKRYKKMA